MNTNDSYQRDFMALNLIREFWTTNTTELSPWQPLDASCDRSLPKLDHLRRAARAGLLVPEPTMWAFARDLVPECDLHLPALVKRVGLPCIVRSISPTEDTAQSSQAGQFLSVVVNDAQALPDAVAQVVSSLPVDQGRRQGAVAVQPFLVNPRAGVTFFDGFYFEESVLTGQNTSVTAGRLRGQVERGYLMRDEPRSLWVARVHKLMGQPVDVEWTEREDGRRVLLQARPALFPVRRNEMLSLANHKETLGDLPSPWIVGVYSELGHPVLDLARRADPSLPDWKEPYAVNMAGRTWLNFSSLFRLMDRWGLPRTLVCQTVGGASTGRLDTRFLPRNFLGSLFRLARMACVCVTTDLEAGRQLRRLEEIVDGSRTLLDLWNANVQAHRLSVGTNFTLIAAASSAAGLRRWLGLGSSVHSVTQGMMDEYAEIAARPMLADRLRGLDDWLQRHGHRGPHETDPAQPRFAEQREVLAQDLSRARPSTEHSPAPERAHPMSPFSLGRLLCRWETRREWFRDELMRRTQWLRRRILDEAGKAVVAGHLDVPDDVFWLDRSDLAADPSTWRMRIAVKRLRWRRIGSLDLPTTASRDDVEAAAAGSRIETAGSSDGRFAGIGLGSDVVTGAVVKAQSIDELLHKTDWPDSAILVVDALEPSWAVVYSRFAAVVSELGGELSHAAILLREAGVPSVINAPGVFHGLVEGELVRVDPPRGEVVRLTEQPAEPEPEQEPEARSSGENVRHPAAVTASSRPGIQSAGARA